MDTRAPTPPKPERRPHTHEAHGHRRADPYHWMRDDQRSAPAVLAHLEAENAYTEAMTADLAPLRGALLDELKRRVPPAETTVPIRIGPWWYSTVYVEGLEYPRYVRGATAEICAGPEPETLLDLNVLAEGHAYYAIAQWAVSDDSGLIAYAEDTLSRRIYTIRFKDLRTGELLEDAIPGTSGALAWAGDNRTIFYVRRDETTLRPCALWRHTLGTDASEDVQVYVEPDETFALYGLSRSRDKSHVALTAHSTLSNEILLIPADRPEEAPRPLIPRRRDHRYQVDLHGGQAFIRTNDGALDFRLVEVPLADAADPTKWVERVPHRPGVFLADAQIFDGFVAVEAREDAMTGVRILDRQTWAERQVPFEEPVHVAHLGLNPEQDEPTVRVGYSSPLTPQSTYDYDPQTGALTLRRRREIPGGFDGDQFTTEWVQVKARDGELVPVSLVYPKDLKRDGSAPMYLYGYGSYGITIDPDFNLNRLSLLDRGFVIATAHVRGSQARGRRWYDQGRTLNKLNTFYDFIDCAERLHALGFSSPARTVAGGGSAGGLLMGAVVNMRPDLFRAIYAAVPFVDVVSTMLDDSIPLTTGEYDEWGNPNDKQFYDYILSYSPYDNVTDQTYPAMYITTGLHDSQVQYWEPAKWVACLRDHQKGDAPILMEVDLDTGHGGASGRFKRLEQTARVYAFMLSQVGDA